MREDAEQEITLEHILDYVQRENKEQEAQRETLGQKRYDQYQLMLQELLYEELNNLSALVKSIKNDPSKATLDSKFDA